MSLVRKVAARQLRQLELPQEMAATWEAFVETIEKGPRMKEEKELEKCMQQALELFQGGGSLRSGKSISCCELCFAGTNGFRLWGLMITWWPGLKAKWINDVQTRWERLSIVDQQLLQAEQELQELETLDKDPACWGSSFGVLWKYGSPFPWGWNVRLSIRMWQTVLQDQLRQIVETRSLGTP